jgi:DNA-binding Lrp family transcriptional regulator
MAQREIVDQTDLNILDLIKRDARLSFREIGKKLGISTGTVSERIKQMQRNGVIRGFVTAVDPDVLGYRVSMLLCVRMSPSVARVDVEKALEDLDEASCIHYVTGDIDMVVLVRAKDQHHAAQVLDTVRTLEGVDRIDSHVVLNHITMCHKCGCDCGWEPEGKMER